MKRTRMFLGVDLLFSVAVFLLACKASADTLTTTNNEHFVGKIIEERADMIIFQSDLAGRLAVPRSAVKNIERTNEGHPERGVDNPRRTVEAQRNTNSPPGGLSPTPALFPFSSSDRFDWIQLKSGEWLKGKVKSLQDEKLEFDSEEMDLQKFDWKDIRLFRSPSRKSIRLESTGKDTLEGSLLITTNRVFLIGGDQTNDYPRSDLLAITPTGSRELDKWSADLSLGLSFRSGNTKEVDFTAEASIARRTPSTRLGLEYLGNYGKVSGTLTENNHRVETSFDLFLSRRLFLRIPDIEYYKDPLQNIDHRLTLGGSIGYDLIHTSRVEWDVTVGPAWQRNWFVSAGSGDAVVDGTALVFSTRCDLELTKRLDLLLEYRGQVTGKDQGDNLHHGEARLEFEIHKRLNLNVSFIWDRIASPEAESSENEPVSDDFRLAVGLGVKF